MDWATAIFPFENRIEPTRFVRRVWRTRSVPEPAMISVAVPTWQIVFVQKSSGAKSIFVRGPETAATIVEIPQDAEFLGIQFELGVFVPSLPLAGLADSALSVPVLSDRACALFGDAVEIPSFDTADVFVNRLVRAGLLVRDGTIEQALLRQPVALTDRSIQRRFVTATGLTYGAIRQMARADRAADLLRQGVPILDVVDGEGFSDQAHLTRSLKKFLGKTPRAIARKLR